LADIVDAPTRSRMMAGIRGSHTKPELIIRRGLHALGFRFRLHSRKLPGKPDLIFPRYRAAIFVHGCFWHGHDCSLFRWPKTREGFWREKISGNRTRDLLADAQLRESGWRVLHIWECALRGTGKLGSEKVIEYAASWIKSDEGRGEIRGNDDRAV
jgi:DNA mismatch endonuclease, patch repair protein